MANTSNLGVYISPALQERIPSLAGIRDTLDDSQMDPRRSWIRLGIARCGFLHSQDHDVRPKLRLGRLGHP